MLDLPAVLLAVAIFGFGVYATAHTSFGRGRMDPGPFWVQSLLEVPTLILHWVVPTTMESVSEPRALPGGSGRTIRAAKEAAHFGLFAIVASSPAPPVSPTASRRSSPFPRPWVGWTKRLGSGH